MALLRQLGFSKKAAKKLDKLLANAMLVAEKKSKLTYIMPWCKKTDRII